MVSLDDANPGADRADALLGDLLDGLQAGLGSPQAARLLAGVCLRNSPGPLTAQGLARDALDQLLADHGPEALGRVASFHLTRGDEMSGYAEVATSPAHLDRHGYLVMDLEWPESELGEEFHRIQRAPDGTPRAERLAVHVPQLPCVPLRSVPAHWDRAQREANEQHVEALVAKHSTRFGDGWELAGRQGSVAYLERPIQEMGADASPKKNGAR